MIFAQKCDKEAGRKSIKKWYAKVGEFDNKAFNDIAAAMYDREDEILNYFVNRSTNASAESLNAKIKDFRAQLRGVIDKKFFIFRLSKFSVNPRGYAGDPYIHSNNFLITLISSSLLRSSLYLGL